MELQKARFTKISLPLSDCSKEKTRDLFHQTATAPSNTRRSTNHPRDADQSSCKCDIVSSIIHNPYGKQTKPLLSFSF